MEDNLQIRKLPSFEKAFFDAANSHVILKWCAGDFRIDVGFYSQLWINVFSGGWLHSFVWWWWRAAAALPHTAENESPGCSWTLKLLNVGLHFLQSLPSFLSVSQSHLPPPRNIPGAGGKEVFLSCLCNLPLESRGFQTLFTPSRLFYLARMNNILAFFFLIYQAIKDNIRFDL